MKFYDRQKETEMLLRIQEQSIQDCSRMTIVTGRRRIGKTWLIKHTFEGQKLVYMFIARKSEAELVTTLSDSIRRETNLYIPDGISSFPQLLRHLLELGRHEPLTIAIDEFHEFFNINPTVFSDMQNIWDSYKEQTHVNLIISGSVYRLMKKIFMDNDEPLFNRADNIIRLQPFGIQTMKEILADYNSTYTNDDLLALYTITGGVPKYMAWLFDNGYYTKDTMYAAVFSDMSHFVEEGSTLLVSEFGKNYGIYFSILQEIALGFNTQSQLENRLGGISLGGYIKNLEDTYSLIRRERPIFSKPEGRNVRFVLNDNFLTFWFRYFEKNRAMVEIQNFEGLLSLALSDYETYTGLTLERYFRLKLAETKQWREIGSWWKAKAIEYKGSYIDAEVDVIAISLQHKEALVAEVKRKKEQYQHDKFMAKVEYLKKAELHRYKVITQLLTLEDM